MATDFGADKATANRKTGGGIGLRPLRRAASLASSAPGAARIVESLFIVVIAILSARLFWTVFAPLPTPVGAPVPSTSASSASAAGGVKNPFSTTAAPDAAEVGAATGETLSETSLDLTLYGVWLDESGGTAFIGRDGGPQKRYRRGDLIGDGVRLAQIHENWVAISRSGVTEALRLKNRKDAASELPPTPTQEKSEKLRPENASEIFRFAVDNRRPGLARVVLIPGPRADVFTALGFEPGDILTAIDGEPVDVTTMSSESLANKLSGETSVNVTVERAGESKTIDVKLAPKEDGAEADDKDA